MAKSYFLTMPDYSCSRVDAEDSFAFFEDIAAKLYKLDETHDTETIMGLECDCSGDFYLDFMYDGFYLHRISDMLIACISDEKGRIVSALNLKNVDAVYALSQSIQHGKKYKSRFF